MSAQPPGGDAAEPEAPVGRGTRLQRLRWPLMLVVPCSSRSPCILYLTGGRYQSTDDAYIQAATVSISANVAGRVLDIYVHDNEIVKRGDSLYRLDDAPFRIAVSDAEAKLASTRLQVASLKSTYRQRQVELQSARDSLAYAQRQFDRNKRLLTSGIASQAQFDQASNGLDIGHQQVANAEQGVAVALANLGGDPEIAPERHPLVEQAQAALDRARLDLSYTLVKAPADGIVTKVEQLQVGDYIAASAPVFALGVDARCVDRGELQGGAAQPHAAGASRHGGNRPHRRQALLCQGGEREPRHGIAVLDAASRECHGQLGQGRATRPRPLAARPCRRGPSVAKRLERQRHRRYAVRGRYFFRRAEAFVGGGDARIDAMSVPIEGRRRALITVFLMTASIMQVLDNTIANVALPRVQGALSATQDQMAWVLTSYIVAAAIMTPMAGWLAGRFGRKRIVLISIAGFTLASMLCGIAQSLPQMVLARLLQGACGAALVPMSQAVMLDIYPGEQLAKAMSIWVTGITIGPIMGPALGGWLTDNHNWRWVFYINVPIGIVAFLGTLSDPAEIDDKKSALRFLRLRDTEPRGRRAADHARSRPAQGLVQLAGDLHRGGGFRGELLSLHRAHDHDAQDPLLGPSRSSGTETSWPGACSFSTWDCSCTRRSLCCRRCCRI